MLRYYVKSVKLKKYLKDKDIFSCIIENKSEMIFEIPVLQEASEASLSEALYEILVFMESNIDSWSEWTDDDWIEYSYNIDFGSEEYQELKRIIESDEIDWIREEISSSDYHENFISHVIVPGTEFIRYKYNKLTKKEECVFYAFNYGTSEPRYYKYDDTEYFHNRYGTCHDIIIENNLLKWIELDSDIDFGITYLTDSSEIAFENCSLIIPDFCENIDSFILEDEGCINDITDLKLVKNIKKIAPYAFFEANTLRIVEIGKQVEYIGFGAFARCSGIHTIKLPSHLDYSDKYLFGIGDFSIDSDTETFYDKKSCKEIIDDISEEREYEPFEMPDVEIIRY